MIRGLEAGKIISFPVWIIPFPVWIILFPVWIISFPVWKITFELLGKNEKLFAKKIFSEGYRRYLALCLASSVS